MANITGNYEENGKYSGSTVFENSEVAAWDRHWWGAKQRLPRDNFLVLQNMRLFFPFSHKQQVEAMEKGTVLHQQFYMLQWYCELKIHYFYFNSAELGPWKFASTHRIQRTSDKTKGPCIPAHCIFGSWEIHNDFVWHCICVRTAFKVEVIQ